MYQNFMYLLAGTCDLFKLTGTTLCGMEIPFVSRFVLFVCLLHELCIGTPSLLSWDM